MTNQPLLPADVEELERLLKEATPGEWLREHGHRGWEILDSDRAGIADLHTWIGEHAAESRANGELIFALKSAAPSLIQSAKTNAVLVERLQAIIDWSDLAMKNPAEFDSHGVRNLDGPVFDEAREVLARLARGEG